MSSIKKTAAITSAKLVKAASKLKKTAATAAPGYLAEKIDPNLLDKLGKLNFPKGVIVVTGTNGKTTTTMVIAEALRSAGISFINNQAGSNMSRGVISSILASSGFSGKTGAEMGLFEVDEAYLDKVCKALKPKMVIVTNLFRDQLDRYGELDSLAEKFRATFNKLNNNSTLVLNADDPLVASLGMKLTSKVKVEYFGISDSSAFTPLAHDSTADSTSDPFSGESLSYSARYFGHIGIYKTKSGGFARPNPQINATKVEISKNKPKKIDVTTTTELINIPVKLAGAYNIYNVLPAIAVANNIGIANSIIVSTLAEISAAFGRSESIVVDKTTIHLYLIKNPTGFNQIIQSFVVPNPNDVMLIAINDNLADGRDISWLWDCAIEDMATRKAPIILSGTRGLEMQLRLVYAGYTGELIYIEDIGKALNTAKNMAFANNVDLLVLPTYTAMLGVRSDIQKLTGDNGKEFWQ
jgi:UDP-N-acetylmuramyl tripeptide synthase